MMTRLTFVFICFFSISFLQAQPSQKDVQRVLSEINLLRSKGCQCGNRRMPPVKPLEWHDVLYQVSNHYARYLARNRHFDHISKEGEDLGDRLDKIGYQWTLIGENLGVGYDDFYQVFKAWQKSADHCRMLMNPDMTHIGMSKHKKYWVQSFSKEDRPFSTVSAY